MFFSFLLYRMIEQVQYCDITDKDLYLMAKDRSPSPRIMLNARRQPIAEMQQAVETDASVGEGKHFDDTEYFCNQNRFLHSKEEKRVIFMRRAHPRCANKIVIPGEDISQEKKTSPLSSQRTQNLFVQFLSQDTTPFPTPKKAQRNSKPTEESHRNYSSLSTRRKFSSISSIHYSQKNQELQWQSQAWNKSPGRKNHKRHYLKTSKDNRSCNTINPYTKKEYLHQRVASFVDKQTTERFNSLDYSIIKPNQIRAVSLTSRDGHPALPKKSENKEKYQFIIAVIQQRQHTLNQQLKARLERKQHQRQQITIQTRQKSRPKPEVSPPKRACFTAQQRNQVQPWQVQSPSNMIDII